MPASEDFVQKFEDVKTDINQLAYKIDVKSRKMAKKMHNLGVIYIFYGALDGLSLSYSMIKYLFDLHLADSKLSSSDEMHEWLVSPLGAVLAASSSIFLVGFSMLANHFDDDDKDIIKSLIATYWPYLRDLMKGLKNAYKGLKSTLQVAELLGGMSLKHLIFPIGITLGILSALNRIWLRWMVSQRKEMMKDNAQLLNYFQKSENLSLEDLNYELTKIKTQTTELRALALFCAAYGGVIDGLYLYIGVLGLCSLTPPTLIAMAVFCTIYFAACIMTRVYEEYDFQQKLLISQAKIELAYEGKKIELLFENLQISFSQLADNPLDSHLLSEQEKALYFCEEAVAAFKVKQDKLRSLTSSSYTIAFLMGTRNGLAAYGALASILFVVGIVVSSFPPALLISIIVLGMSLLIGFIVHALITNYFQECAKQEKRKQDLGIETQLNKKTFADLEKLLKNTGQEVKDLKPEEIKTAILDGMVVDPSPQFFFQEWFEVIRSFFTGLNKGVKAIDLTLNPLETPGADGHYHETSIMVGFMVVSACVHALTLALRALSRGFGRKSIDAVPLASDDEIELKTFSSSGTGYEDLDEDEFQPIEKLELDCESSSQSEFYSGSMHSFFSEKTKNNAFTTPIEFKGSIRLKSGATPTLFKDITNEINQTYKAEGSELDHYTF
ncbi:MAG: hypothetical protein H0U57_09480 [Tatlockia sp.]|nr:hypothetical protein [Tatlockia sp.]